jgi:hypothetical protein
MAAITRFGIAVCVLVASCRAPAVRTADAPSVLATVPVRYVGSPPIGMACLPPAADSTLFRVVLVSTLFRVVLVVDSLSPAASGDFGIYRAPRPETGYANVSASLQRSERGSRTGMACPLGTGVLFRAKAVDVPVALVTLDAPAAVLVSVFDALGRPLAESTAVTATTRVANVAWQSSAIAPPNEELKLSALASDAAGSLRSPAALFMVRRSLTPAR